MEGAIFIRCNSVGSPAVWRGNVSLLLAQDICHLVTATQGSSSLPGGCGWGVWGGGQDCHSAPHWTAGHGDDWWTAVFHLRSPCCWLVYIFFTRTDKKEWLEKQKGLCLIWAVVKWRVCVRVVWGGWAVTSASLIRSTCPPAPKPRTDAVKCHFRHFDDIRLWYFGDVEVT